jgi:hypothetical protein
MVFQLINRSGCSIFLAASSFSNAPFLCSLISESFSVQSPLFRVGWHYLLRLATGYAIDSPFPAN